MQKILVLGTGNAQADFILFCKEYGLEVHSCSYRNEGRGIKFSDYFVQIDIANVGEVLSYARDNEIDLIYTTGSEIAMPTISRVSESLSLPVFNSTETTTICQNKHLMRKALSDFPEFTVDYRVINDIKSFGGWSQFPAIVKPADSQGQRGISIVKDKSDFENAFKRAVVHSLSKTVIIEELIEGYEISINAYVVNGKPELIFLTERISFEQYPGGIIKSHKYPISKSYNEDKIHQLVEVVLTQLGIKNGPAYFQVMISNDGSPRVIEVTPRLDGCHIWRMIYHVHGINLFKIILDHLILGKIDVDLFRTGETKAKIEKSSLDFFTQAPCTLMQKDRHSVDKNAVYKEWYCQEGEEVQTINGFEEKVGYQITLGKKK